MSKMTKKYGILGVVIAITCLVQHVSSSPTLAPFLAATSDAERVGIGKYIVVLKNDKETKVDATSFVTREFSSKSELELSSSSYQIEHMYDHAISGFSASLTDAVRENMRILPEVKYIEEVVPVYTQCIRRRRRRSRRSPQPQPKPKPKTTTPPTTTPPTTTPPPTTKPPLPPPNSWGLDRIDQRDLPLDNEGLSYQANGGAGAHIYIVDTGVSRTHNEFKGRFSDDGFSAFAGPDDGFGKDCNGHGTHVAGTAAGATYGVASQATIHSVRVFSCAGYARSDGLIRGIDWIAENAVLPAVASMSLGTSRVSVAINDAVEKLFENGIVVSVSGGNDNTDACDQSPASTPNAITVGATDIRDNRASFSNFGSCLDIFAPGVDIKSAWIGSDSATKTISGTSMACPHVSGVAAILLGRDPNLTPAQITAQMVALSTVDKVLDPRNDSPNSLLYIDSE